MPRRKRPVGSVVHAARCSVCDTWTTVARDGTLVIHHKDGCSVTKR